MVCVTFVFICKKYIDICFCSVLRTFRLTYWNVEEVQCDWNYFVEKKWIRWWSGFCFFSASVVCSFSLCLTGNVMIKLSLSIIIKFSFDWSISSRENSMQKNRQTRSLTFEFWSCLLGKRNRWLVQVTHKTSTLFHNLKAKIKVLLLCA